MVLAGSWKRHSTHAHTHDKNETTTIIFSLTNCKNRKDAKHTHTRTHTNHLQMKLFTNASFSLLFSAAAAVIGTAAAQEACQEVTTVPDLDLDSYISARWYVHQQAVTEYSPLEWNYCSYAEYTLREKQSFLGYKVDVTNYAEDVDGNTFGGPLCAAPNRRESSKLSVAPCIVPRFFAGPYWIVAYDEEKGYALVSGGQPTIQGEGGCRSGDGVNNSGLWIFSRSPQRDEALITEVRGIATKQGFDLSVLNDVIHQNCVYENEDDEEDEEDDGNEEDPPTCEDSDETFVRFGIELDCDYVAARPRLRCWLSGDNCPATCGGC